ncbi:hypothetical protein K3Z98_30370, partial [Pseudomonas aeruginosa]|nr:hypothetical protein [Pseudomonas aeruginosa]
MRPAFRCGVLAFALAVLAGCGQRTAPGHADRVDL